MRDLQNPRWMYLKAVLFLLIGAACFISIVAATPTVQTALLLLLAVWSFCRAYYFAFYVIERYIDPTYKYSGLISAARHAVRRAKR